MTNTKSQKTVNRTESTEELLETIQTDIKFYTQNEDGTFDLERKSIEEIEAMFGKCFGLN